MTKTTCSSHTYRADRECAINSSPPQSLIPVTQRPHEVNVLVMTGRSFIVGCVHSFCASVTASMAAVLAIPKKIITRTSARCMKELGRGMGRIATINYSQQPLLRALGSILLWRHKERTDQRYVRSQRTFPFKPSSCQK